MTVQQDDRARALRGLCGGAVCLPGDAAYDLARTPWNLMLDDHPAAVAYPAGPQEVGEVVRAAAASGLSVAAQGTGHGAPPLARAVRRGGHQNKDLGASLVALSSFGMPARLRVETASPPLLALPPAHLTPPPAGPSAGGPGRFKPI